VTAEAAQSEGATATSSNERSSEANASNASTASSAPAPARAWRFASLVLVLVVTTVGVLAMPKAMYRGDPLVMRMATSHLITEGTLWLPSEQMRRVPSGFKQPPGRHFFEDAEHHRFWSKYGVLDSLLFLPPMLIEAGLRDEPLPLHIFGDSRLTLLLNIWNVLATIALALYLLSIARRMTSRPAVAVGVVLSVLYATSLWFYLRAQSMEIFQVLFFTAFVAHLLRWYDAQGEGRPAHGHFVAAAVFGTLLTLLKAYFGLVFPIAWAAWLIVRGRDAGFRIVLRNTLMLGAAGALAAALVLTENTVAFGDPLSFGYGQYRRASVTQPDEAPRTHARDSFSFRRVPRGVKAFHAQPSLSILTHAPLLWLLPFAAGAWWRRDRFMLAIAVGCWLVFTPFIGGYSSYSGHWGYGPRLLLFFLPVLALGAVAAIDWLFARARDPRAWLGMAATAAIVLTSFQMQVYVNSLGFHANYLARRAYRPLKLEELHDYFEHTHYGMQFKNLREFAAGAPSVPGEIGRRLRPEATRAIAAMERELRVHEALRSNWYWFSD
jgi:hypothetical protein